MLDSSLSSRQFRPAFLVVNHLRNSCEKPVEIIPERVLNLLAFFSPRYLVRGWMKGLESALSVSSLVYRARQSVKTQI